MKSETDVFSKITSVFLALLMTVFLFSFGPDGYLNILAVKRAVFYVLCGGYCAVMLGLLVFRRGEGGRRSGVHAAQIFAVLYLLFTLIATLVSPFRPQAWLGASRGEGFFAIAVYCLTFLFVSRFAQIKRWMVRLLGASCVLFSLICVLQLHSVNVFSLFPEGMTYWDGNTLYRGQYIGTIGNVDHVAAFLSLAIPMLACAVLRMKNARRFWLLVPLAMLLYVLARIDVAAGLLAVGAGALCCLPVVLPGSKRLRLTLFALLFLLIASGLLFVRGHDFGSLTLHEAHELLNGRVDRTFGSGRIYIWTETLRRAALRLPFGYGPDTMILTGIEPFRRFDERTGKTIVSMIDAAHNEYLNILFHQGVFALLTYLGMLVSALALWIRHAAKSAPAAILGCGVLCYCIQALFGISQVITTPFFWVTMALLVSCKDGRITEKK